MNFKIYQVEKDAITRSIEALEAARETLEKFDGNVITKKINEQFPQMEKTYIHLTKNQYNEKYELEITNNNYIDMGFHVEYAKAFRRCTVCNITDPGEKRLDYKRAEDLINDEIKRLSLQWAIVDRAQQNEETIMEEQKRLLEEIEKFNKGLDIVSYNLYSINRR